MYEGGGNGSEREKERGVGRGEELGRRDKGRWRGRETDSKSGVGEKFGRERSLSGGI